MTIASDILVDFYADRTQRLVERLVKRRRAPGEDTEASLCIGGPADFDHFEATSRVTVTFPGGNPDNPPEDEALQTYLAVRWELEDVRVENPADSEQYVITKRIKQARYRRPDGSEVQLDNRPIFADFPAGA